LSFSAVHPVSRPEKILVRGVNWLGDAVMTTPAVQQLREHFPGARLALLTDEKLGDLWLHSKCINEVITFKTGETPWSIAGKLRSKRFDLALILPNSTRSAIEMWLAGIPARVGYTRPLGSLFLSRALSPAPNQMNKRSTGQIRRLIRNQPRATPPFPSAKPVHHTQIYLRLVGALGAKTDPVAPRLQVNDAEVESAKARWLGTFASSKSARAPVWVGVSPSAAYGPAKCWPLENFTKVIQQISARFPETRWLGLGGPDDLKVCAQISRNVGDHFLNLAGKTTIRDLMALLKICKVLLTNDSGPMHLAAALETPVVVPFGSTSPELTGPGLPGDPRHVLLKANVPCSPCFRRTCPIDFRCMSEISVSDISDAVAQALNAQTCMPARSRS
jgi:ADP-heptose:LPS heptosyltransferase